MADFIFFWDPLCTVATDVGTPANGIVTEFGMACDRKEDGLAIFVVTICDYNLCSVPIRNSAATTLAINISVVLTL